MPTRDVINEQSFTSDGSHIRINSGPFLYPNFAHCLTELSVSSDWTTIQSFYGANFTQHLMDSLRRDQLRFNDPTKRQETSKLISV